LAAAKNSTYRACIRAKQSFLTLFGGVTALLLLISTTETPASIIEARNSRVKTRNLMTEARNSTVKTRNLTVKSRASVTEAKQNFDIPKYQHFNPQPLDIPAIFCPKKLSSPHYFLK